MRTIRPTTFSTNLRRYRSALAAALRVVRRDDHDDTECLNGLELLRKRHHKRFADLFRERAMRSEHMRRAELAYSVAAEGTNAPPLSCDRGFALPVRAPARAKLASHLREHSRWLRDCDHFSCGMQDYRCELAATYELTARLLDLYNVTNDIPATAPATSRP